MGAPCGVLALVDRIGLRWRAEVATEIVASFGRFDLLEVIADEFFDATPRRLLALRTLAREVPVVLHGVGLGLSSSRPIDDRQLARVARLVEHAHPQAWSEHLAIARIDEGAKDSVRLVAPPRTTASADETSRNIERATKLVGLRPFVENVAGSFDPRVGEPLGERLGEIDEAAWMRRVLSGTSSDLLLDLHNLHANATRLGFDARAAIAALPPGRIRFVHVGFGPGVEHGPVHPASEETESELSEIVIELLAEVGRRATRPVTVVLECDDASSSMERLLGEVARARAALAAGRRRAEADAPAVA